VFGSGLQTIKPYYMFSTIADIKGQVTYAVEAIRPTNVGSRGKVRIDIKQLIRHSQCHHIRIHVDDFPELGQVPQIDFSQRGVKVETTHQVEIHGRAAVDGLDWDDVVVDFLRTRDISVHIAQLRHESCQPSIPLRTIR
jgi:hypothetical protein